MYNFSRNNRNAKNSTGSTVPRILIAADEVIHSAVTNIMLGKA